MADFTWQGEYNADFPNALSFGGQLVTHSKYLAAFNSTGDLIWEKENSITSIPGDGGMNYGVRVDSDSNVYFIGATGWQSGMPSVPDSFNGIRS
jgi:outer membrane protein assembly factor BamB